MRPTFTLKDIEHVKKEIEADGYIACTDEFMDRLRMKEDSELDSLDEWFTSHPHDPVGNTSFSEANLKPRDDRNFSE